MKFLESYKLHNNIRIGLSEKLKPYYDVVKLLSKDYVYFSQFHIRKINNAYLVFKAFSKSSERDKFEIFEDNGVVTIIANNQNSDFELNNINDFFNY